MPQVQVAIPGSAYAIQIGADLLAQVGPTLRELGLAGKAAIVTHPELPAAYTAAVHASLEQAGFEPEMAFVPQGEASKSLDGLERLYTRFAGMRLDRKSAVVALGGGVIGDLAGFAAATYLRGLALVQVPTTLLAQVDASIGGKTAIDLLCGKNLVGAFYQPRAVIADVGTLATLPPSELRSGLAEVVKYGVIADAGLFASLEREADRLVSGAPEPLTRVVVRCCEGHLFTTIRVPSASLKAVRLGLVRFQRCPVGRHWTFVVPVRDTQLTDEQRQIAGQYHDARIPL